MAYNITIKKDLVIYHAEAAIRKVLDVRQQAGTLPGYHLQPDEDTGIDKELIHRIIELRDADVSTILAKYLGVFSTSEDDELQAETANFEYALEMPDSWPSSMLRPLTTYIHNYLVSGILYDYLKDKMPDIAQAYFPDVENLKQSITDTLNIRQGIMKRPLQPFRQDYDEL